MLGKRPASSVQLLGRSSSFDFTSPGKLPYRIAATSGAGGVKGVLFIAYVFMFVPKY